MKVVIDHEICQGCATCDHACPEVFRVVSEQRKSYVIDPNPPEELYPDVQRAVNRCDFGAISIEEDDD